MSILLASTFFNKIIIILLCLLVDTCNFSLFSSTVFLGNYDWINSSLVLRSFYFYYTVIRLRYISKSVVKELFHHEILFWVNSPRNFVTNNRLLASFLQLKCYQHEISKTNVIKIKNLLIHAKTNFSILSSASRKILNILTVPDCDNRSDMNKAHIWKKRELAKIVGQNYIVEISFFCLLILKLS